MVERGPVLSTRGSGRFATLHHSRVRHYLVGAGLAMMGDAIEHVITYWVLWQMFESVALVGFQAISHWLPFLVLSVFLGRMAARLGPAWMIVAAQGLFLTVSVSWGLLFAYQGLQVWEACVLLVLHGLAGASWGPAEQLALHRLVAPADLPSAVRLNATFRTAGVLCAPIVGAVLLSTVGPTVGILLNALCYVPLIVVVIRSRILFAPEPVAADAPKASRRAVRRTVLSTPALWGAMSLSAVTAVTVGGMLAVSMAAIADDLTGGEGGVGYGVLLFAGGLGSLAGGVTLEASGRVAPVLRTALATTGLSAACVYVVATVPHYGVVLAALFVAGVFDITSTSIGQTVVQMAAPATMRGAIFGLYGSFSSGFRLFGGVALVVAGTWLSVQAIIGAAAVLELVAVVVVAAALAAARRRRRAATAEARNRSQEDFI